VTLAGKLALGLSAVLAGGVIGLLVVGRDDDESSLLLGRTMGIATSVSPRVHLFGDPVVAHVDLMFDERRVDPDRITVDAIFRPYEQVGTPRRERSDAGHSVRIRYSYPLQCFARACAPTAARREVRWPPVRVVYSLVDVRARANDVAEWPPVSVASRLGPFDVQEARWRADLEPPDVSYRVSPSWFAAGLAGSSLLLLFGAGALAAWLLARRPAEAVAGPPVETASPLERALERVVRVSANGAAPERRRALEGLARELDRVERPELAARARRLGWSPAEPNRAEVEDLAADVRSGLPEGDDGRAP
jgi:hypothetical protein